MQFVFAIEGRCSSMYQLKGSEVHFMVKTFLFHRCHPIPLNFPLSYFHAPMTFRPSDPSVIVGVVSASVDVYS